MGRNYRESRGVQQSNYVGDPNNPNLKGIRSSITGDNSWRGKYAFGAPDAKTLLRLINGLKAKLGNPAYGPENDKLAQLAGYESDLSNLQQSQPTEVAQANENYANKVGRSNELMRILRGNTAPYDLEAELARLQQNRQNQNQQPNGSGSAPVTQMSRNESLPQIYNFLNQEKSRVANLPRANYQGKQVASEAPLTRQARELRDYYANKGSAYGNKQAALLGKQSEGFSPQNMQQIQGLNAGKQQNIRDKSLSYIKGAFDAPWAINENKFNQRDAKDFSKNEAQFKQDLGQFDNKLRNTENMSYIDKLALIKELGADKTKNRESLINELMKGGRQQQAHENMDIESRRNRFNQEANRPYENINNLERELEPHRVQQENLNRQDLERKAHEHSIKQAYAQRDAGVEGVVIPDEYKPTYINGSRNPIEDMHNALKAYGVDVNSNPSGWGSQFKGNQRFNTQEVANLPHDLQQAHGKLSQLHPSDPNMIRKQGIRALVNAPNIGNQIVGQLPQEVEAEIARMEKSGRRDFKRRIGALDQQFLQQGQKGSAMHTGATSRAAREHNDQLMQMRQQIIQNAMGNRLSNINDQNQVDMRRASEMGQQRSRSFGDKLNAIANQNYTGMQQFNNAQDALDRKFKKEEEESNYMWPGMRDIIRQGKLPVNMLNRNNVNYE